MGYKWLQPYNVIVYMFIVWLASTNFEESLVLWKVIKWANTRRFPEIFIGWFIKKNMHTKISHATYHSLSKEVICTYLNCVYFCGHKCALLVTIKLEINIWYTPFRHTLSTSMNWEYTNINTYEPEFVNFIFWLYAN